MGAARDESEALKQMEHVWKATGTIEFAGREGWTAHKVRALEAVRETLGGTVESVLDLGPGDLEALRAWPYFPHVPGYVGVEGSAVLVADQRERYPALDFRHMRFSQFVAQDVFTPEEFDVTLMLDMLYHIPENDVHDALLDMAFAWEPDTAVTRAVVLTWSPKSQDFGGQRVGQGGFAWFPRPYVGEFVAEREANGWERIYSATFTGGPQAQVLAALVKENA